MSRLFPRALAVAAGTLTSVPVPIAGEVTREDLVRSTGYYPVLGLLVGALPALALLLPEPPQIRSAIALVCWVLVTGALHLDGWADCCDAAFAPDRGADAEPFARRLAILKDPHVGVFGVAGVVLLLLLKYAALSSVSAAVPLLAAPIGRYVIVRAIGLHPPARPNGLAAMFGGKSSRRIATAGVLVIAGAFGVVTGQWVATVGSVVIAVVAATLLGRFLVMRFGGATGDVYGAVAEIAEVVVLLAWVPWQS